VSIAGGGRGARDCWRGGVLAFRFKRGGVLATAQLEKLKHDLTGAANDAAARPDKRNAAKNDLAYLEGYLETPAALMSDLIGKRARARQ
jgi:hypothetical protein